MVINIRNNALTLYANYNFNSLASFKGLSLGASATGIANLNSGTKDNNTDIEWNFRTGYLDMRMSDERRINEAWFSFRSDGNCVVTIIYPDGNLYEYELVGYEIIDSGVRVKFGKGIKEKYLALDVKSKDGSSIVLDSIRANLDSVGKRG